MLGFKRFFNARRVLAGVESVHKIIKGKFGFRLLIRDHRTVRLTAAGETFRREALKMLRRNQEAVRLTRRASLGEIGQLRIGFLWRLVESGIGVSIVSGSGRHLLRRGGLVVFCRLQPASAPVELRMSWRRAAPSSPTVEAFRELVQSQREAIRAVMEARPVEDPCVLGPKQPPSPTAEHTWCQEALNCIATSCVGTWINSRSGKRS
jgi:hypothetical protein